MNIKRFSSAVSEKLGYYVYLYVNPLNDRVFYIGKGQGNRAFDHLEDKSDSEKVQTIKAIRAHGQEPGIEILVHGLLDEDAAYRIEAAVIDLLGVHNLSNSVRGYRSTSYGRMSLEQVISHYERERADIEEPAILIRINNLYRYGMSAQELYDATRGIWKIGERRNRAQLAFAVYGGLVREVYRIERWYPAGTTPTTRDTTEWRGSGRWEFVGHVAEELIRGKYMLKSVDDYLGRGAQNPIKYVNC